MFLLVDSHGMAHRCYHANARNFRNPWDEGLFAYSFVDQLRAAVQAVEGAVRRRREAPEYVRVLCCWDTPTSKGPRLGIYSDYKAKRQPSPPHLTEWIENLRRRFYDVHPRYGLAVDTLEADDLIAIIVQEALSGVAPAVVLSRDQDLYQLLAYENVEVYDPRDKSWISPSTFEHTFGFPVEWWNLYRAVVGDKSDNWGGVKGTGEVGMKRSIEGAIRSGWTPQKMIDEFVRDGYGETLVLGMQLVALPFPEADYQTALQQFSLAIDDEEPANWAPLFDHYGIQALDPDDVGGWLA